MPIAIIRPNGTKLIDSFITPVGAANIAAATSDQSDSTYAAYEAATYAVYTFQDPSLPAGAVAYGIRPRVRARRTAAPTSLNWESVQAHIIENFTGSVGTFDAAHPYDVRVLPVLGDSLPTTFTEFTSQQIQIGVLSQSQLNNLDMQTGGSAGGVPEADVYWSEIWIEIHYATVPTTTVSTPTGTQSTNIPLVSWAHSAGSDGGPQTKYRVKVFSQAQYTAGGFNPATSGATWDSGEVTSTATSVNTPALPNGVTYRAYVITSQNIHGTTQWADWTSFSTFTVSLKPVVAVVGPSGVRSWAAGPQTIDWDFQHPDGGQSQSAYRVIIKRQADNSTYIDTGKTVSTTTSHTVNPWETLLSTTDYYYTVQVWDTLDVASDVSAPTYVTFTLNPNVIVNNPSIDEVLTATFNIEWQIDVGTTPLSQTNQNQYRVLIFRDGPLVYDTGWVISEAGSWTPPDFSMFVPGSQMEVEVQLKDDDLLEGTSGKIPFTVDWPKPNAPGSVSVNVTQVDVTGPVIVSWDGAARDGSFAEWRVYRRLVGMTTWTLIGTSVSAVNPSTFSDYAFSSGFNQEWAVVQVATRFGAQVESVYNAVAAEPESNHYWIFDYDDPDLYKIMLDNVTADNYADEFEEFESRVIGRGRRIEIGDHDGARGTLTEQDRTPTEASSIKAALTEIRLQRNAVILRTPFGDTFKASLGNIDYARVPGVGRREMLDITIPYVEVF